MLPPFRVHTATTPKTNYVATFHQIPDRERDWQIWVTGEQRLDVCAQVHRSAATIDET
jgi:hypothetical protein